MPNNAEILNFDAENHMKHDIPKRIKSFFRNFELTMLAYEKKCAERRGDIDKT
jgi:hypothetical protein